MKKIFFIIFCSLFICGISNACDTTVSTGLTSSGDEIVMSSDETEKSVLRIRAHRDELIAMELELANSLQLASDGSLLSSPI